MASIIKIPAPDAPGVVVFTTQERDHIIHQDPETARAVEALKKRWVIGLHHNWHDWSFNYDPLFDFSMAGEGDLIEVDGKPFERLPMDACNFVPESFYPARGEKFWDILYVARAVSFKRIPEFFQAVRELYDRGHMYRVLLISPVPPYQKGEEKTVFYEIRKVYDEMFSDHEQNLFTLMTIEYRYPFPFDLPTLAHFYRSSRTFVHFADQERRCRVAAYAWATGLPVIGMESVVSLLPGDLAGEPGYYRVKDYEAFPDTIVRALENPPEPAAMEPYRKLFTSSFAREQFKVELKKVFDAKGKTFEPRDMALEQLDIRLGRHHGRGDNPNSINIPLIELARYLADVQPDELRPYMEQADPEIALAADKFTPIVATPPSLMERLKARFGS